jgi:hypothetical protein
LNEWAKENTLVRSGTTGPFYWNFDSMDQLYEAYSQAALKKGLCVRSRSFIYFFSQKHKIKFMHYDRYLCPKCNSAKHSEKSQIPSFHEEAVKNQSSYFKQMLSSLSETQYLIIQDYTTIHEDSQSKIRILNLTVYTKSHSGIDAELNVHYVDFIGYMKCNYQVTQYVLDFVIDKLYRHRYTGGAFIWSDNGFKNKMNLYYFFNLQKKVQFKNHCHFLLPIMDTQFVTDILGLEKESSDLLIDDPLCAQSTKSRMPFRLLQTLQLISSMSTQNHFPKLPKVSIWKIRSANIMNGSSLQKEKSTVANSQERRLY